MKVWLNSKRDYENYRATAPEADWRAQYQILLDSAYNWFPTGQLENESDGITDDTHKVEVSTTSMGEEETTTITQYEWKVNNHAKIFRIGYTIEEVQNILK